MVSTVRECEVDVGRSYTAEEMEAIVRRALLERGAADDVVSHEDLLAAAAEVGISAEEVEAAAEEVELEREHKRWEEAALAHRRRRFGARAVWVVVLNGILFAVDALTGGGWWVQWVALGTGIWLGMHALRLFRPVGEREVERQRRNEERRDRRDRRRARALRRRRQGRSGDDFEAVVERGVDLLLDAIGSRMQNRPADKGEAPGGGPRVRVEGTEPGGGQGAGADGGAAETRRRSEGSEGRG